MSTRAPLHLTRLGWGLALPAIFLLLLGLSTIHASDASALNTPAREAAASPQSDPGLTEVATVLGAIGPLTLRQAAYIGSGILLLLLVTSVSYQTIGRYSYLIYGFVIFLLLMLVADRVLEGYLDVPLVPVKRNTRRWIEWGPLSLQPSEFVKVALILALARYLRFRASYRRWSGLATPFLLTLAPMLLIQFQPDLGTLLMLLPVLFAMLFVAGARPRHLALVIGAGVAIMPVFYIYGMHDYQRVRIDVLLKQGSADERWHMNQGYQLRQSKMALGTGGLLGEGYGQGVFFQSGATLLPDEHNDFIFAIVGHQWGLIGCVLVVLAYGVMVLCGIEIATVTNDPFGRLLAVGVIVMIVFQALLNIGMTIGLMPITGMTLPFVSFGGSSLWANFLAIGLLVNVAQRRPMLIAKPPFEHRDA